MSNNHKYKFHLLREEVASQDAFSEKTHEHVADALANIILQEKGGITIGLEGSWGSGKSTVINLLQSKLKNAKVFIFDAWAHEGDCLRRIFLESLLNYVQFLVDSKDQNFHGDTQWIQDELQTVDRRKQKSTVKSNKHPTAMGIILAITIYVASIGIALFGISKNNDDSFNRLLVVACALIVSPLVAGILYAAYRYLFKKEKLFSVSTWSFVQADSTDTVEREVSEEEERSSIEFERFFAEIMDRVTKDNPDVKFIFAIDNLDRIAPENSLSLWSTLQTFLQKRSRSKTQSAWFKSLYIIVPYDPAGLEKIWSGGAEQEKTDGNSTAKSFFDKCFQIRLEVPAPVMTDWENFAASQIEQACPEWEETEKHTILDVLRFSRSNLALIPTPREIKNYVNQVCVQRSYCSPQVSTACIAYYTIARFINFPQKSIGEIREDLSFGKFPDAKYRPYLPSTYAEEFAGLIFGVSPEKGHQLLLEPEIRAALDNGDAVLLKNLSGTHGDGFWHIFDFLMADNSLWNGKESYMSFLARSAAIFKSEINIKKLDKFFINSKKYISALSKLPSENRPILWAEGSAQQEQLIFTIQFFCQVQPGMLDPLYNPLLAACNDKIKNNKDFITDDTSEFLFNVLAAFSSSNKKEQIEFSSLDTEKLLKLCHYDKCNGIAEYIRPPKNTVAVFNSLISSGSAIPAFADRALRYIFATKAFPDFDFTTLIDACKNHIFHDNGQQRDNNHSTSVFDLIFLIIADSSKYYEQYINSLDDLLNDWRYYNFVRQHEKEQRILKAILLSCVVNPEQLHHRPIGTNAEAVNCYHEIQSAWKHQSKEMALALLDEAETVDLLPFLWEAVDDPQNLLFEDIVELAMSDKKYEDIFCADNIELAHGYKKFIRYANINDKEEKEKKFLDFINTQWPFSEYLVKDGIELDGYFDDYRELLVPPYSSNALVAALCDHCRKLPHNVIFNYLAKNDAFIKLIMELHSQEKKFLLGHEFYSVLTEIMTTDSGKEIRERWYSSMTQENWMELTSLLESNYKKQLRNDLTNYFVKNGPTGFESYWKFNRKLFVLDKITNDFLNEHAWQSIHNKNELLVSWIADLISKKSTDWQPDEEKCGLIDEPLRAWFESASEETKKHLQTIAKAFSINLSPKSDVVPDVAKKDSEK